MKNNSQNSEDVIIRVLEPGQIDSFIHLIGLFEHVFEMKDFRMPPEEHLSHVLGNPDFRAFVAEADNQIAGGATVYILHQYYSTKPLAYLYDLAVLPEFQRMGIGRKIIGFIREYCRTHDMEEVFVQADEIDDYALTFYRSTDPTEEEKVRHFYYLL
jgi:aminoglycoside 3-N-acetyltransferase I